MDLMQNCYYARDRNKLKTKNQDHLRTNLVCSVCVCMYIHIASLSPSQSFPLSIHTQFISNLYAQNIWTLSPQVYIKYFPPFSSIPCLYPVTIFMFPWDCLLNFCVLHKCLSTMS